MESLLRRLTLLVFYAALVWHLIDVLQHRSDFSQVLQRYSLSYFAWVVFYCLFWLIWTAVTVGAFFRWNWIIETLKRVAQNRRLSVLAWFGLPLIWFMLLGWVTLVGYHASSATPHSGSIPLLLAGSFVVTVLVILISHSMPESVAFTTPQWLTRLSGVNAAKQLNKVAKNIAAKDRSGLIALLTITLVCGILCAPAIVNPNKLIDGGDIRALYYVVETYATRIVQNGNWPFWNPYLFSGFPLLSRPDSMFFYPIQFVLRYFVPVNTALAWGIALHIWIAGAGMYWLCRHLSLHPWIALICALTFMLNGGVVLRIFAGHIWLVYALAWMPLMWLCLDSALENNNWLAVFGGAGVLAVIVLSGHPTFPGYVLLFLGICWLCHVAAHWQQQKNWRSALGSSAKFLVIIILGIGLASIQLAPSLVFASQASLVSGYGFDDANFGSLVPQHLLMIFLPDTYRQPGLSIWELLPYVGVILPLAAPWAFLKSDYRRKAFFLGFVALFSLALAYGHELRVFSLMYYAFPPFRVMRIPARALIMWIPSIIVLGGIGLQVLAEQLPKSGFAFSASQLYRNLGLVSLGVIAGYIVTRLFVITLPLTETSQALLAVALAALIFFVLQLSLGKIAPVISPNFGGILTVVSLVIASMLLGVVSLPHIIPSETEIGTVIWGFAKLSVLLLAASVFFPLLYQLPRQVMVSILFVCLVFADIYSFGTKYIQIAELPSFDRVAKDVLSTISPPPEARVMGGDVLVGSNALMPLKIGNIDGYYSGMLTSYATYLRGVAENPPYDTVVLLSNIGFPRLDRRALNYLNVTHIFSKNPLNEPGYELVAETPDYFVYQNLDALPRAFWVNHTQVVPDTAGALQAVLNPGFDYRTTVVLNEPISVKAGDQDAVTVKIVEFEEAIGGLTIQTQSSVDGVLVISEPYYSERRAWIDGQEVPLLKANVAFSAVALPPGSHTVQIGYTPTSLYVGFAISAAALVLCLIGVIVTVLRRAPQTRLV